MKVRIVESEAAAFLITHEPGSVEIEMPADLRQRWEDAWGLWSDVNEEIRVRYQSALSRNKLAFEVDGANVRQVVGGEQDY